jgi:predicted nucleic-acid-binding Zn-ribbon protein
MGKTILVPLHRKYLRSCKNCGYQWQVSRGLVRSFAGKRAGDLRKSARLGRSMGYQQGPSYMMQDEAQRDAERSSLEALSVAEQSCARCGSTDFSQRPWREPGTASP